MMALWYAYSFIHQVVMKQAAFWALGRKQATESMEGSPCPELLLCGRGGTQHMLMRVIRKSEPQGLEDQSVVIQITTG